VNLLADSATFVLLYQKPNEGELDDPPKPQKKQNLGGRNLIVFPECQHCDERVGRFEKGVVV
jgi:hypothetical protein